MDPFLPHLLHILFGTAFGCCVLQTLVKSMLFQQFLSKKKLKKEENMKIHAKFSKKYDFEIAPEPEKIKHRIQNSLIVPT